MVALNMFIEITASQEALGAVITSVIEVIRMNEPLVGN